MQRPSRPILDVAFGATFLVLLAVPGILALVHGGENVARAGRIERRRPPAPPQFPSDPEDALTFSTHFDPWFKDAWGGREAALRLNARMSMEVFGTSPSSHLVFGRNDWVFSREHDALASFTGVAPITGARLGEWQRVLEDRRQWLAERGIEHLVVFVPHKSSIYPDELPGSIEAARGVSRLKQFLAFMAERSDVRVLDLAPALRAARALDAPRQHVYSPHGVHWTAIGCHAAYEVIVGILADELGTASPIPLTGFEIVDRPGEGDSWATRMYLRGIIDMENLSLAPREPTGVIDEGRAPNGSPKDRRWSHPDASRPRVLVVHDSFGPGVLPLLALHASVLEARWRAHLETSVVERIEPDIVIELYSELALVTQRPFRRAEFLGPEVGEAFAAAPTVATLDLTAPLTFDAGAERVTQRVVDGGVEVTVENGVAYLALGSLDIAAETELLLGLDLASETRGVVAFYRGDRLSRSTPVSDLMPLEIGGDVGRRIVPLPSAPAGASTWMVLTSGLGRVTLRSLEIRESSARRY